MASCGGWGGRVRWSRFFRERVGELKVDLILWRPGQIRPYCPQGPQAAGPTPHQRGRGRLDLKNKSQCNAILRVGPEPGPSNTGDSNNSFIISNLQ